MNELVFLQNAKKIKMQKPLFIHMKTL